MSKISKSYVISHLMAIALILFSCAPKSDKSTMPMTEAVSYPNTRMMDHVDDYHGHQVSDPYRWLEDDNSEETGQWVEEQNAVTNGYLTQIPYRDLIKNRLEQIWNYERFGSPFKRGDSYYFFRNDGLQNQSVLYRQQTLEAMPEIVLDPNGFSEDGTVALGAISFNREGTLLAYQTSEGGSDWRTIQVLDLKSGELLSDRIEWVKFSSIAWAQDGFYYSRFPEPSEEDELSGQNQYHRLCYHKLGNPQEEDIIVMQDPENPQSNFYGATSDDERYLFVSNSQSTSGNALYFSEVGRHDDFKAVTDAYDHDFNVIEFFDNEIFILTNQGAPKGRLISLSPRSSAPEKNWKEVIPESEHVLQSVQLVGGKLFARYLVDAKSAIKVFSLQGNHLMDIELPGIGSVSSISGSPDDSEAFYSYSSYTYPTTIFSLNTETGKSRVFKSPVVQFDIDSYETKQVFYTSKDGTRIPMFLTHKKGLDRSGSNPTILYGYGGFDISLTPGFSTSMLVLLENGGIYAVANLRGGGEYGKDWHLAGTKERKQNVFDDFQSAAEYLIAEKYTSSQKLAIMGGSNGGLLVGACMTQRPDLYKVAIPRVGVLDMLRYHEFTIGWAWAEDYGRSDDPEAFDYLYKYSPLHNVEEVEYPATLVTTADHDDRVVPAHSFKFISELQRKQKGTNPTLIRVETSAGHGAGKPVSKIIEETADMLSFTFYNFQEEVRYPDLDKEK